MIYGWGTLLFLMILANGFRMTWPIVSEYYLPTVLRALTSDLIPDSEEGLLKLSLAINEMIESYANENGLKIISSSQGYQQYPEEYPGQQYVQLFSVLPSQNEKKAYGHCSALPDSLMYYKEEGKDSIIP